MADGGREIPELGTLEAVTARAIWTDEARDFTPWLRDHPDVLAKALDLDIEIHDSEVPVGLFAVDLVGDDNTNRRRLIVENQLEPTNHSHLGQLLTYAGGLNAATIVWISPTFRDEHRQALDWLNTHTDESIAFFGLQLEVVRIGDSKPAVNLKPVATPNAWGQTVRRAADATEPTDLAASRQRFFEAALTELKRRQAGFTSASRVGAQSWFSMSAGRTGFLLNWSFSQGSLRTELYIDTRDQAANKAYFDSLQARAPELERSIGFPLVWDRLDERRASRIYAAHPVSALAPDKSNDELRKFAVDSMLAFGRVFRPIIRALPTPTIAPQADEDAAEG